VQCFKATFVALWQLKSHSVHMCMRLQRALATSNLALRQCSLEVISACVPPVPFVSMTCSRDSMQHSGSAAELLR
jgi:hypothetical protein